MATPEDDGRLDDLEHKIDEARKQAEDHGTIPADDPPEPEYQPGDPVGLPDPEPEKPAL
jgi:hypothetical protein